MRVGFFGLGNMGLPMAANVLAAGFDLTVHNRTRSKSDELVRRGARLASSPAELTASVDVVLTCLASVDLSRRAFLGEGGIVEASRPGQLLVDHSTVDPATSRAVHERAQETGAAFLDAPISGGPEGARDGTLSIMAGGDADAFEKARPVFEAMGSTVLHMGDAGAGTITKLANQLLVGVHALASCEALCLARKAGVDLEKLVHVLERSWGQSRILERNAPRLIREDYHPSAAPLRNLDKDLSIIIDFGREIGVRLPAAAEAATVYARLVTENKGEWDMTAAATLLEADGPPASR